ncbi:MAG: hypothetical protein ACI4IW_04050 [Oscillospiraceae bacterium]
MENWEVLVFIAVLLVCSVLVRRFIIKMINSADRQSASAVIAAGSDDPLARWNESGRRRDFENADYELPAEDFFENEKTELPNLEKALEGLSEREAEEIMRESGILDGEEGEPFEQDR